MSWVGGSTYDGRRVVGRFTFVGDGTKSECLQLVEEQLHSERSWDSVEFTLYIEGKRIPAGQERAYRCRFRREEVTVMVQVLRRERAQQLDLPGRPTIRLG